MDAARWHARNGRAHYSGTFRFIPVSAAFRNRCEFNAHRRFGCFAREIAMSLEALNYWVALGTVGMQCVTLLLLAFFFVRKDFKALTGFVEKWGLWLAFLLTIFSIGMALYYSDFLGIIPCSLCWYQRIFLFPQAILFAIALWKKEAHRIADYSIVLSVFGAIVALYQHYIQMVGESPLPCPASGGDCVKRFLFEFGYITFPLISFSAFAFLIVVMLFLRARRHAD